MSSFEGVLPKRIKNLPLDQMFEISSVKKVVDMSELSFAFGSEFEHLISLHISGAPKSAFMLSSPL